MGNKTSAVSGGMRRQNSRSGELGGPTASTAATSSSRNETVEAGVLFRKGMGYLATKRYDDAITSFDDSLKFR